MDEDIYTFKFSDTATAEPPDILKGLTPKDFLKSRYIRGCVFGLEHLQREGVYLYLGWCYDFKPFLKKFLVYQYGSQSEVWAINKTSIRNSTYGRISNIVEID